MLLPLLLGSALGTPVVHPWVGGDRLRVQQTVGDLPVEGAELVYTPGPRGEPVLRAGVPLGDLTLDPVPSVSAALAEASALALVGATGEGRLWEPRSELVAWVDARGAAHLVWAVDASTRWPVATWRVLVDAHTGDVLRSRRTSRAALGRVYETNPAVSDVVEVELHGLQSDTSLDGEHTEIWSCLDEGPVDMMMASCDQLGRYAVPDASGDYLFDPAPGERVDPFAEVHLYHHIDTVSRYADTTWGFTHPQPIRGIGNFELANAFWGDFDGDGVADLAFGTTGDTDFAYDADVVYHEFGHSVIHGVSSIPFMGADEYGLVWDGGALDEGSADTVSMFLTGDPAIAEYAGAAFGDGPLRDLAEPRRCPDDLLGESHADGEIFGSLMWQLMADPSVGPELTAQLWYGAVTTWTEDVTWGSAGTSLLDAAAELLDAGTLDEAGHDAVVAHLEASGMLDCGRVVPLDGGRVQESYLMNLGLPGDFAVVPLGLQLSLDVPEDAGRVVLEVEELATSGYDLGYAVYVRRGEHVVHEVTEVAAMGLSFAIPREYDAVFTGSEAGVAVDLSADSELVLEPGATYYFAVGGTNLGGIAPLEMATGRIALSARWEPAEVEEAPGGCACASGSSPAAAWLLLLPLAFVARRRR